MNLWMQICFFLSLTLLLQGCSAPETRVVDDQTAESDFPFLRDGKITRGEILDRFGHPVSNYEDGRIVIYWLHEDEHGALEIVPKNVTAISLQRHSSLDFLLEGRKLDTRSGYYNLVLVFDDNGILAEHSLVFIR